MNTGASPSAYFKILSKASEVSIYKEKGSKFYGMAFPVKTEKEIKKILEKVKSEHYKARHHCYAWRLGIAPYREKAHDDGEPSHSAGAPILGQINAFGLTDTLIIVVRYFGGIKLGVGGLIRAYKTAAYETLQQTPILTLPVCRQYEIHFHYPDMNDIQRIIKSLQLKILSMDMKESCTYTIEVPLERETEFTRQLEKLHKVTAVRL